MPSPAAVASTNTYRGLGTVYERARPAYPEALLDAIVRRVGVTRHDPVADCVFRTKPDTDSGGIRTPVPIETGQ